jgi:ribonuclease P protein component
MPSIAKEISKFTRREIEHLFKHARCLFKAASCTVLAAPRQGAFGRILIITSAKVGNAPERNLIRRRIKSIFYEEKLFEYSVDCAFIAQKKLVDLSFPELKQLILEAYRKVQCRENRENINPQ